MIEIRKRGREPATDEFYTNEKQLFVRQPVLIGDLVFYREFFLDRGEVLGDPAYTPSCRYSTFRRWVKYKLEPAEAAKLKIPDEQPRMASPEAQFVNALFNRRREES